MARVLHEKTISQLRARLESERERIVGLIGGYNQAMEDARMSEGAGERSSDPASAEAGAAATDYETQMSLERNATMLLEKVNYALAKMDRNDYGDCDLCGKPIPVARLRYLPYVDSCIECAGRN
ncbi:MAG: TraR/DksA family transcriptional regulator [bacterium]|nr:TraR/DksA family transcriptional regulator [Acidimicrobiia bacterium]MCY4650610.1 TraR/DksA family transcriptional regulator [bacterium]